MIKLNTSGVGKAWHGLPAFDGPGRQAQSCEIAGKTLVSLVLVCLCLSAPVNAQEPDLSLLAKDKVADYLSGKNMPFIPPPRQMTPGVPAGSKTLLPRTVIGTGSPWPRERFKLDFTAIVGVQRRALISGHAVKPGDSIGGAQVLAITHGQVRLKAPFGEFTLKSR